MYKRQAGIERGMRTGLIEGTIKTCMDFQVSKEQIIAVSYTHLDVYKRQLQGYLIKWQAMTK